MVLLIVTLLFTVVSITILFGTISPIARQLKMSHDLYSSKKSYFAADAGAEDAFYRMKNNINISFPLSLSIDDSTVTITSSQISSTDREIFSQGVTDNNFRAILNDLTVTDGFAFNFAVQVGIGGLRMQNDSDIIGNVYSNGSIDGDDENKNFILGDAVSAGSTGDIEQIHATSSVYAHNVSESKVDRNAYYQTIDSHTIVTGTKYPNSPDQPLIEMPIADTLLDQWETTAVGGGTITSPCPYIINNSVTLGPKKINCDVRIKDRNTVVTLSGVLWINGNLVIEDDSKFKVSDSVGNKSVPIIVKSTSDPSGNGKIDINNKPTFYGSETNGVPNPDSYVMLVSRNIGAEIGNDVKAITAGNNVTGNLLLYAPHGKIELSNNVILREVTSYQLTLKNNVQVYYSIGLAQPLFVSGPGGKWKIKRWKEGKHQ